MKAKLKIGPQTALDYKRTIIPEFEKYKSTNNLRVKDQEYFGCLTKNLWDDYGKLIEKNKTFLSKERNEEIMNNAKKLEQADMKQKQIIKTQKVLKNKAECNERIEKKLLEIALIQQQSSQDVDDRQIQLLLNHPRTPLEINQAKIRSPGRHYLNGQAENKWNDLTELCHKNQKVIFTPKVIQFEKEGIKNIQNKVEVNAENKDMIKSCFVKQGEDLRKSFLKQHQQNLENEKDLRIGVFGKNGLDQSKKKIVRIALTPATYNRQFPTKYKMDPYIQKLKEKPIAEKQMQLYIRLSSPKKQYEPQNVFDHSDFSGMITPAIDKVMCVKQDHIVNIFKENQQVQHLANTANDPYSLNSVIRRPNTATSQRKGFQMEPLSSFDDIQVQRSQNFNYPVLKKNEVVQEIDNFQEKIKQSGSKQRPLSGFCKVTLKENQLLKNVEGLRKIRELKKEQNYPYNLIKGLDNSL